MNHVRFSQSMEWAEDCCTWWPLSLTFGCYKNKIKKWPYYFKRLLKMGAIIPFYVFTILGHIDCTTRSHCVPCWRPDCMNSHEAELNIWPWRTDHCDHNVKRRWTRWGWMDTWTSVYSFQVLMLSGLNKDPWEACNFSCDQESSICLYLYHLLSLVPPHPIYNEKCKQSCHTSTSFI